MVVRESVHFKRGIETKEALGVGLEDTENLRDYTIQYFTDKGYYTDTPGSIEDFSSNSYYKVVLNVGVSPDNDLNFDGGLSFMKYKPGRAKTKYGVDARNSEDGDPALFESDYWQDCFDFIENYFA